MVEIINFILLIDYTFILCIRSSWSMIFFGAYFFIFSPIEHSNFSFITSFSLCLTRMGFVSYFIITVAVLLLSQQLTWTSAASDRRASGDLQDIYGEKVQTMTEWSSSRPLIKINTDRFKNYVRTAHKNYSVVVMFTANSPQRGCSICKQATEEFQIVANSWHYLSSQHNPGRLFFGIADFDDNQESFQQMGLQSVPVFVHFPPKSAKPRPQDTMDIQRIGFEAEQVGKWVSDRTELNVRIFRPPNYSGTLAVMMLVGLVGLLLYVKRNSLEFLYSRQIWGISVMAIIFCMISGQMWNQIRGPPFMHRNQQTGAMLYILPNEDGQFIAETMIIGCLYMLITLGMILLYEVNNVKDATRKKVLAIAGISLYCVFFSFLISIFRSKYGGYPYSFLFK